jgi:hypothetical protein
VALSLTLKIKPQNVCVSNQDIRINAKMKIDIYSGEEEEGNAYLAP